MYSAIVSRLVLNKCVCKLSTISNRQKYDILFQSLRYTGVFNNLPYVAFSKFSTSSIKLRRKKLHKIIESVSEHNIMENLEDDDNDDNEGYEEDYNKMVASYTGNLMGHSNIAVLQPWIKWGHQKKNYTSASLLLNEACSLIHSLPKMTITHKESLSQQQIMDNYVFGSGTLSRLISIIKSTPTDAVFVNMNVLSRTQKSSLEECFGVRVFDRFTVVLAIFKHYAMTTEAKMQITLAELPMMRCAVNTEVEKLILHKYEARLKKSINKMTLHRNKVRERRKKHFLSSVAIVGYTNCGKTSFIQCATRDEKIMGEDRLFATLDVTSHKVRMPTGLNVLFIDSVGFIQDISSNLLASFKATLQDALFADVIVHIRDISHPDIVAQTKAVNKTLEDLNIPETTPIILVNNKVDLLEESFEQYPHLDKDNPVYDEGINISCLTGEGIPELLNKIQSNVLRTTGRRIYTMKLKNGSPKVEWLKTNVAVIKEVINEDDAEEIRLYALMNESEKASFIRAFRE